MTTLSRLHQCDLAAHPHPPAPSRSPLLQGRMTDSNRNLAAKVLMLLGDIAKAMGPPFDKGARAVLAPAVANLSDNKKQVGQTVHPTGFRLEITHKHQSYWCKNSRKDGMGVLCAD